MSDYKYLLTFCLSALAAAPAYADTPSCVSTNCATLGYTKTAAACSGAETIKCPFDTSKVICLPKASQINTPVFNYVAGAIEGAVGRDPSDLTLDTKLDDFAYGDWQSPSYDVCWYMDGAYGRLECDETTFELFVTVGDIVTWVEEQLMQTSTPSDPCSGSVTVNSELETCTSYCSSDSTKCMTKRNITCDEAITKAGGTKLTSGTYTSLANATYYLTTDINFTRAITSISGVTFYEASILPPCANDSSVKKHPKLTINSLSRISNSAGVAFHVDTNIAYMYPSNGSTIRISHNFKAAAVSMSASSLSTNVSFYIYDNPNGEDYNVILGLDCEETSEESCNINIHDNVFTSLVSVRWCNNGYIGTGDNIVHHITDYGGGNLSIEQSEDESLCYIN